MGVRLMVEVLDHAPGNLTPAERLVLVAIAEAANDNTREGWPGMDILTRRTGLSAAAVTKVLQRLAARTPAIDVRIAIGKGRDGRAVYATRGHQTTYRIPHLRVDHGPAFDGERVDGGPLKGGPRSGKGGPPSTPSPHIPSENPHLSPRAHARAVAAFAGLGVDQREIQSVLEKIQTEKAPRNLPAYVETLRRNGDLYDWVRKARTGAASTTSQDDAERCRNWRAEVADKPDCPHGEPGGDLPEPTTAWLTCAMCRRQRSNGKPPKQTGWWDN